MNHTRQTLTFVVVATVLAGVALATHLVSRVTPNPHFEKVGTVFYEGFDDPNKATSLRVVSYNDDEARVSEFQVEFKDGLWRIPSHHNYPADAKDRLARAAASLIAVQRDALASRREADHERLGVINPETDDLTQLKGLGQRVTIKDAKGQILVDLIIGDEVEDQDGYYYVRRPDEKETFRSKLDVDLSTKFANWIEQDLLKMDRWNAVKLVLSKPGVSEEGRIIDRERVELSRPDTAGQWQLAGLDEKTEEVNRTAVDDLLRNLDNLEIVGVRPKPQYITPDLRVNVPEQFQGSRLSMQRFAELQLANLATYGFQLGLNAQDEPRIYSPEGEVILATNDGVTAHLHLGDVFTGTLQEIEIGGKGDEPDGESASKDAEAADASGAEPGDGESSDAAAPDSPSDDPPKDKPGVKLHRYVFVRAQFDPAHIGPEPVKPEEPQKPEGLQDDPAASQPGAADAQDGEPAQPDAAESEPEANAANPSADQPSDAKAAQQDSGVDEQSRLKFEYDAALKDYETSLKEYERKKADYDRKVKEGREKVEELNRRFRDWYYVISGTSLENLKIARADLVKPKTETGKKDDAPGPALPSADDPSATGSAPDADATSPADDAPAANNPQTNDVDAPSPAAVPDPADREKK